MAKTITLRYPSVCAECRTPLQVGERARWYGKGRVYGTSCHGDSRSTGRGTKRGGSFTGRAGWCEDAPCCGCCGPGSDDPAYAVAEPYERGDDFEDYR